MLQIHQVWQLYLVLSWREKDAARVSTGHTHLEEDNTSRKDLQLAKGGCLIYKTTAIEMEILVKWRHRKYLHDLKWEEQFSGGWKDNTLFRHLWHWERMFVHQYLIEISVIHFSFFKLLNFQIISKWDQINYHTNIMAFGDPWQLF